MTPAKRPSDVRRLWASWPIKGEDKVHAYKWTSITKSGFHYDPVAIVDLRPEAQERLAAKVLAALVENRDTNGSVHGDVDAVLAALFGAKKGRK